MSDSYDAEYIKECIRVECGFNESFLKGFIKSILLKGRFNATYLIRRYQYWNVKKHTFFARHCSNLLVTRYGIYIGKKTRIGKGLILPHPTSIVFGNETVIGNNALIFQQTTFGSKTIGNGSVAYYPCIGNNCIICAGAKILSGGGTNKVSIGNNVIVGANSLVLKSVKDDCICAGTPAKIIKELE